MPAASSTQNSYKVSGGLHGVGVSVVNALSEWLELRIWRDGKEHFARFEGGETCRHLKAVGGADGRHGTEVRFLASRSTFSNLDYSFKILESRLRELAFLNSGVRIRLRDERPAVPQESEFCYAGGVREFVRYLDRSKTPLVSEPIFISGGRDGITVEAALWWNDSYHESVLPFTNNIPPAGWRHPPRGVSRSLDSHAQSLWRVLSGVARKEKVSFTGDDAPRGPDLCPERQGL